MFAQEPPPDFGVPGRREPGDRPELVADVGLAEVACATGEVAPVDRSGGVDREHGGGEAVGAGIGRNGASPGAAPRLMVALKTVRDRVEDQETDPADDDREHIGPA
jgi:hypothetical protein